MKLSMDSKEYLELREKLNKSLINAYSESHNIDIIIINKYCKIKKKKYIKSKE